MKKCIICRERVATLPDRESMGRRVNRVCRECHAERIFADLRKILNGPPYYRPLAQKQE